MYKIAVFGERDSVLGFSALGLQVFPMDRHEGAAEKFRAVARSGEYAIIYVTESFYEDLKNEIDRYKDSVTPAIILIPGTMGTMGTMGVALMGIGFGLGMNPAMTAGAIISGAYFGDKMSPLSDTTNLAPAMAGTDVMTHVKAMLLPTAITYGITLVIFGILGATKIKITPKKWLGLCLVLAGIVLLNL